MLNKNTLNNNIEKITVEDSEQKKEKKKTESNLNLNLLAESNEGNFLNPIKEKAKKLKKRERSLMRVSFKKLF